MTLCENGYTNFFFFTVYHIHFQLYGVNDVWWICFGLYLFFLKKVSFLWEIVFKLLTTYTGNFWNISSVGFCQNIRMIFLSISGIAFLRYWIMSLVYFAYSWTFFEFWIHEYRESITIHLLVPFFGTSCLCHLW